MVTLSEPGTRHVKKHIKLYKQQIKLYARLSGQSSVATEGIIRKQN